MKKDTVIKAQKIKNKDPSKLKRVSSKLFFYKNGQKSDLLHVLIPRELPPKT